MCYRPLTAEEVGDENEMGSDDEAEGETKQGGQVSENIQTVNDN